MKEKNKNMFRWIAVIPCSYLVGILATFPLHWLLYSLVYFFRGDTPDFGSFRFFTDFIINKSNFDSVELFLSPIITMVVTVMVGFKIAPKYKFETSAVLAVLWLVTALICVMFVPTIKLDVRTFFTFLAILITLYVNWKKSKIPN